MKPKTITSRILLLLFGAAVLAVLVACGSGSDNATTSGTKATLAANVTVQGDTNSGSSTSGSQSNPSISWTPSTVSTSFVQGQSRMMKIEVTAHENIPAFTVEVSRSLQPYLSVSPIVGPPLAKGQTTKIFLLFNVSITAPLLLFDGTVTLSEKERDDDRGHHGGDRIAKPLPVRLTILSGNVPGLPPDPGAAGRATVLGIDSNNDGVRDDVERYIALTYPNSEKTRKVLTQLAISYQLSSAAAMQNDAAGALAGANKRFAGITCLYYVVGPDNARSTAAFLYSQQMNTKERILADAKVDGLIGGAGFPLAKDKKSQCTFDPDILPN